MEHTTVIHMAIPVLFDLSKYKECGHFFFEPAHKLSSVCNAPTDKSGIYLIYELRKGKITLVYIGCSGKLNPDGSMFVRRAGLGGIKDRIVNGKTGEKIPRHRAWPLQMVKEQIDALDIYWYATHNNEFTDCPRVLENKLLIQQVELTGRLPKWNKEL
jgi:hypothetical protein